MNNKKFGTRWEAVKQIGHGGQGQIHVVIDLEAEEKTEYALKRLSSNPKEQAKARFKREIETIQRLDHPNIIKIIDFDLDAKEPYFVSELCQGGNLVHWRERDGGHLKVFDLFHDVCLGLAHAFAAGINHRDIKPENILLRNEGGPAVIADWGIAYVEDGERLTMTDEVVGTRFFIDPLLEGGRQDAAVINSSDVYSLGKLLYWMLTGKKIPREDFRDEHYNMVLLFNPLYEHVNRLLDDMITTDLSKRLKDVSSLPSLVENMTYLIARKFNVVSSKVPQPCSYCGQGFYRLVVFPQDPESNRVFFGHVQPGNSIVLVCELCGHVQHFRYDLAKRKDWWQN